MLLLQLKEVKYILNPQKPYFANKVTNLHRRIIPSAKNFSVDFVAENREMIVYKALITFPCKMQQHDVYDSHVLFSYIRFYKDFFTSCRDNSQLNNTEI